MSYLELLKSLTPEAVIALAAFLVLGADLIGFKDRPLASRRLIGVLVVLGACAVSGLCLFVVPQPGSLCAGAWVVNPLTQLVKLALLVLTAFTALLFVDADFTGHVGEFLALVLLATAAMLFLASSEDLLTIFLSLEMTSLCLYAITAFHRQSATSAEAGLKYFLFGSVAAAFLLFGLSLLYGATGHTNLRGIAATLPNSAREPVFLLGLVMTVVGLGFKVAAVPFHLWAPDAYQGAPVPGAALIAAGSKLASFFILAKLMVNGLAGAEGQAAPHHFTPGWVPVLAALAALSMLLGNLAAIAQKSVRRLLAFSAVAQAGYVLVGLLAGGSAGLASVVFYAATYGLTLVGAFGVVGLVERQSGGDTLECFAGLARRAPFVALSLLVFILSLAGIPPLAGFFGKFYLFTAALKSDPKNLGLLWLVVFAVAMSAVSLYYYLQVLKQAYVVEASSSLPAARLPLATRLAVIVLAALVALLGLWPGLLLRPLLAAIRHSGG